MKKWNKMINIKTLENEVKSLIYTIYEAKKIKIYNFLIEFIVIKKNFLNIMNMRL